MDVELRSINAVLRELNGGEILYKLNSSSLTSIARLYNPKLRKTVRMRRMALEKRE